MPRLSIVRCPLAGAAVVLAVLLALPWPRGAAFDALLGRLLAAWHGVTAAVEEPPPPKDETTDPFTPPTDPGEDDRSGPSLDPNGTSFGPTAEPSAGATP